MSQPYPEVSDSICRVPLWLLALTPSYTTLAYLFQNLGTVLPLYPLYLLWIKIILMYRRYKTITFPAHFTLINVVLNSCRIRIRFSHRFNRYIKNLEAVTFYFIHKLKAEINSCELLMSPLSLGLVFTLILHLLTLLNKRRLLAS